MTLFDGDPIWFELVTPDPSAAATFYERVFGWTMRTSPVAEHGGYVIASAADGEGVAGLMAPPPGAPPAAGCRSTCSATISRRRWPGWASSADASRSGRWTSRTSAASPW